MPDEQQIRLLLAAAFIHARVSSGASSITNRGFVEDILRLVDELLDQTVRKDE